MDHLDHIRMLNFVMTFLVILSIYINIFITFDLYYIICLINDICLIELDIGLITIAGPFIAFFDTFTLSTNGCNYCFIHNENGVNYYYFTRASPFDSFFTSSPRPFNVLYTSSVSVYTFENFNP